VDIQWAAVEAPTVGFGTAVAGIGDWDADGLDDFLVGGGMSQDPGVVYAVVGTESEVALLVPPEEARGVADLFGATLSGGDLDGDGLSEAVVGSPGSAVAGLRQGAVWVFETANSPDLLVGPYGQYEALGAAVIADIDINADGYDDVVAGGPRVGGGVVRVFLGGASGPSPQSDSTLAIVDGNEFGYELDRVRIDDDGYDDLVVSDPWYGSSQQGAIFVYRGSASGFFEEDSLVPDLKGGHFGVTLGLAGDLTGDGADDLLVGFPSIVGELGPVYLQELHGVVSALPVQATAFTGIGDADGDSFEDALLGAPHSNAVYVAWGGCESSWYADKDGDGYGDTASAVTSCEPGTGFVLEGGDCDDSEATTRPGAVETACDGVDSNCDGYGGPDEDEDEDGFSWAEEYVLGTDPCSQNDSGDEQPAWSCAGSCGGTHQPSRHLLLAFAVLVGVSRRRRRARPGLHRGP
jgi:hypothetical protein